MAVYSQHSNVFPNSSVVDSLKQFYESFNASELDKLDSIYADDVVFTDPVHTIEGVSKLKAYFEAMCGNLTECRFVFIDELVNESSASLKWEMHYRHPSLKSNKLLILSGVTLLHYTDKVHKHEDFYDMGAMVYEHLPLISGAIRFIKSRLAK